MATPCDVNVLLAQANCFSCLSPGLWQVLELQLLCDIAAQGGGGGGGTGAVLFGHYGNAAPPNPPANPTSAAIAYDLDPNFQTWKWDGTQWT